MSDQPDPSATSEPPPIPDDLQALRNELTAEVVLRTRRMCERQVRDRIAAQLRDAATADPDGVDPLAAAIWDGCQQAESAGAVIDDPRSIATVAYRWLADQIDKEAF